MRQGCSVETAGVVMIAATTDRHRARALPLLYHSILAAPISQMEMNEAFSRPQSHTAGMTVPSAPAVVPPCMNQCCEPVLGGQGPSSSSYQASYPAGEPDRSGNTFLQKMKRDHC